MARHSLHLQSEISIFHREKRGIARQAQPTPASSKAPIEHLAKHDILCGGLNTGARIGKIVHHDAADAERIVRKSQATQNHTPRRHGIVERCPNCIDVDQPEWRGSAPSKLENTWPGPVAGSGALSGKTPVPT